MATRKDETEHSELLTPEEVAAILKLDEKTIRRMHLAGKLVGSRIGRSPRGPLRFRRSDVQEYVDQQKGR